jgi:hypothetical protein
MAAEKVSLSVNLNMLIAEVLAAASVPGATNEAARTVQHDAWRVDTSLISTSTPAPVRCVVGEFTLDGSGDYDLNLAAAPTTAAPTAGEDLTGKNLLAFFFQTPSTNAGAVTIDGTVSNGYDLFTGPITIPKNMTLTGLCQTSAQYPAVAAGDRIIHFDGTAADKIRVKLVFEA